MGAMSKEIMQRMAMLRSSSDEPNPRIAKNTILRDQVNDEQSRLAKQGPLMIRNPKKVAKGA